MSKRTVFTTITPLPAGVTRQIVLDFLHDHEEMIDLNPLVKERHPIPTPSHAPADEQHCQWYSLTDKISYLPGVAGDVTYTCAFNDLPTGIQTHCYAPAGLTIRDKWTVGGSLPGEPPHPVELGVSVPPTGLYLREDVDMRCNVIMASFVKKTLKKSHAALVDRLKIKAEIASTNNGGRRKNRNSDSTITSPKLNRLTVMGSSGPSNINGQHYHHLPKSAPTSRRPSSAASSVVSAASSASCYSVQSSPMWSPPTSSRGTSPALSVTSPPPTHIDNYQLQPQAQTGEYIAQPKQHFLTPQPAPTRQPPPVPAPSTLPAREPETPFLRRQQPATIPEPVPVPPVVINRSAVPEPETPFLRKQQPDWPLKSSLTPAPLQPRQPAAAAADWPLKQRPRPQTQLFIQAYRPPLSYPPATGPSTSGNANNDSKGELSDAALWQALGGGRFVARNAATNHNANANNNNNRKSVYTHAHARTQSQGQASYSHPDYPQMSPYDEDGDGKENDGGGGGDAKGVGLGVGLGVVGRVRGVSMPPPARAGPGMATLNGPFVARLD